MPTTNKTTGLILAGGAGRRVGGRDKGLIRWRGVPMAQQVAERLRPQVETLLISCNRNLNQYAELGDRTVTDSRRDFQGPLAGLEAAASAITTEFLVIAPCDSPTLPTDLAARLLEALLCDAAEQVDISIAHDGSREQYLCAAMRTACLASLPSYLDQGHRTVRHWYQRHRHTTVDFSDQPASFRNLNKIDPDDHEQDEFPGPP